MGENEPLQSVLSPPAGRGWLRAAAGGGDGLVELGPVGPGEGLEGSQHLPGPLLGLLCHLVVLLAGLVAHADQRYRRTEEQNNILLRQTQNVALRIFDIYLQNLTNYNNEVSGKYFTS